MRLDPPKKVGTQKVSVLFPEDLLAEVDEYARMLGPHTDRSYVIVHGVRHFLTGDREFQKKRRPRTGPRIQPADATS